MARINNKINLPTNTTDIKMLANYLSAIDEKKVVAVADEQELFSSVKAQFSRKKKDTHARDTHTKAALSLYGLIDINDDGSFSVSALGKEVVNCFSTESNYSREDKIALMLKVFVRMEIIDNPNNRRIHIGFVILKLLCDSELDFYITNQELAHMVMNPAFISDNQYDEMKQYILDFRNSDVGISQFAPQTKAATFMTTFVTNWEFLTSEDSPLTQKQNKLADNYFAAWLNQNSEEGKDDDNLSEDALDENSVQEIESEEDSQPSNEVTEEATKLNASQNNAKRAFHSIIKYRLNTLSAYIAKIYLSLLEGVKVKDYLSYFTGNNGSNNERTDMSKPLQKIYYGAPGTGKSNEIKQLTGEGKDGIKFSKDFTFRTTFHPDSDYSSFVGAYKPIWNGTKIIYDFRPQTFLKAYIAAWTNPHENVALVIEEINRGNCAQIFGDIFQLLDRESNGLSKYPIETDVDLENYLKNIFSGNVDGFNPIGEVDKDAINNYYSKHYNNAFDKIKEGKILTLPLNLSILCTMNTSDQSLFPMDSAFKRRWSWEYMPIKDAHKEWKIQLDKSHELIDWWEFLKRINVVVSDLTTSEDKQLGYFFCQPDEFVEDMSDSMKLMADPNMITAKQFVDKVIFYLWNDVFKDYAFDAPCCKGKDDKEVLFAKFYNEDGKSVNIDTLTNFFESLKTDDEDSLVKTKKSNADETDKKEENNSINTGENQPDNTLSPEE